MIINSDSINNILHRSKSGFQYPNDGPVLFHALLHAVKGSDTKLKECISKGIEQYNKERAEEAAKEH